MTKVQLTFSLAKKPWRLRRRKFFVLCLLITAIFYITTTNTATAATWYVDAVDGNDANDGSSEAPWKTIGKAQSIAVGGDTVILRDGSYGTFTDLTTVHSDWITYQAENGQSPEFTKIILGRSDGPFNKYLHFEGITIQTNEPNATAVSALKAPYLKFIDCNIIGSGYKPGTDSNDCYGIYCKGLNNVEINGCAFSGAGAGYYPGFDYAIFMRAVGIVDINNCNIKESDTGIEAYGETGTTNWHIHDCNVHDCLDNGVWLNGASDVTVEDNHIHHIIRPPGSSTHNDCLQISTAYASVNPENIVIRRNNMHHSAGQIVMINFIGDAYVSNMTFENNLIYEGDVANEGAWEIHAYDVNGLTFVNNTGTGKFLFRSRVKFDHMTNNILETVDFEDAEVNDENYNIIKKWWIHVPPDYNQGDHTVELENDELFANLFVDYTNNDLQLKSGSRAIDFGSAAHAPISDILGYSRDSSPDAGCYEYISTDPNDQHSLTTSSTSGGSVTTPGEAGPYSYDNGTVVSIEATAASNYHFVSWTGTAVDAGKVASSSTASTTVTMDADYTVVANFAIDQRTLTSSSTTGGSVTTPGEGTYDYDHGTEASIAATEDTNYHFENWTGTAVTASKVADINSASTTVTMDADYTVVANFESVPDETAPSISDSGRYPEADAIQVPLNSLIVFHIIDEGVGVDANTVSIEVNGDLVYTGNNADYDTSYGRARRRGDTSDYTLVYQPTQSFDFDQTVTVAVSATDLSSNQMNSSFSFTTEMRSFGENKIVNSGTDSLADGKPATVSDSSGNIWVAWHAGEAGSRDIYIGKLTDGAESFGTSTQLTSDASDEYNPAIAVDSSDKLYVTWQGNNRGNWDIYFSTSTNGTDWATATRITDSNDNQLNCAIAVDSSSPKKVYITWQDDRNVNEDIYVADSTNSFLSKTTAQVTSNSSDQTEPKIVTDSSNIAYIVWTDSRNGTQDIYGAASNSGPWSNVAIVTGSADQSDAVIAAEESGSTLHLLWVNNSAGDRNIFYASCSGGLQAISGSSVIDDSSGADQYEPSIAVTGSTGDSLKVFACWRDERNTDTDLYFVQTGSGNGTNIFVGDDDTAAAQSSSVVGIDASGYPYLAWTDSRNTSADIYYAGSTYAQTSSLLSQDVSMLSEIILGTILSAINGSDDVCVTFPASAYLCDLNIAVSIIENPPNLSLYMLSSQYEFSPSGTTFDEPVTIIIPYIASSSYNASAYWYNALTAAASQQGITDIEDITILGSLHAIVFKSDHFTSFFIGGGNIGGGGGGGGGGGCSLARGREAGTINDLVLPFVAICLVMAVVKWQNRRNQKSCRSK